MGFNLGQDYGRGREFEAARVYDPEPPGESLFREAFPDPGRMPWGPVSPGLEPGIGPEVAPGVFQPFEARDDAEYDDYIRAGGAALDFPPARDMEADIDSDVPPDYLEEEEETFFEKYKTPVIVVGSVAGVAGVGLVLYLIFRSKD